MRAEVKDAADAFLLKTYALQKEARVRLVAKASREIVENCQYLLASFTTQETLSPQKYAHRLKSNLTALGLLALAEDAKKIETDTSCDDEKKRHIALELCRKITDKLPLAPE